MSSARASGAAVKSQLELPPDEVIFGVTPAMLAIQAKLERVACTNMPVLIRGESGTGKEIIASLIHKRSQYHSGPFVKVNCPAIPHTLMESELFGYERGAFTGANANKPGRFEVADTGTLFLDEIGDLAPQVQAKLLQVLQDGRFTRIGGAEDLSVQVRVVSATNHNLEDDIGTGSFRQDIFYRLEGVTLVLPPLRERRTDIPLLVEYFVNLHNRAFSCRTPVPSTSTISALQNYPWQGNIRELENVIRRYVIFGQEEAIMSELTRQNEPIMLPDIPVDGDMSLKNITRIAVRELERKLILRSLAANNWNRKKTARALKISYRSLMYKLRESNMPYVRSMPVVVAAGTSAESDD
jgi:transcriptional regulator with PAS, ATPase and Fis domain